MKYKRTDLENVGIRSVLCCILFFFAHAASAQVLISEIKYTGAEWIEVVNTGAPIDLSSWKFFEGGTNHKLNSVAGTPTIPTGGYAIIAHDAAAFQAEYPNVSAQLFDSSFSLLDTGETISLKAADGSVVDTVSYVGVKGSKNSTQKDGTVWREAPPTPGAALVGGGAASTMAEPARVTPAQAPEPKHSPQVVADSGAEERTAIVGAPIDFETSVLDADKNPIPNARVTWVFGDGGTGEGSRVSHTYYYAGDYTVVLEVLSAAYSGSARIAVHAVAPVLALGVGGDATRSFVAIENKGNDEINLSGWSVRAGEKNFILPKNTILGVHKTLTLPSEVTGLNTPRGESAELFFVNGMKVETQSVPQRPDSPPKQKVSVQTALPPAPKQAVQHVREESAPQSAKEQATVIGAYAKPSQADDEGGGWVWLTGAALLGIFALLGLRFARTEKTVADEFVILDESENRYF